METLRCMNYPIPTVRKSKLKQINLIPKACTNVIAKTISDVSSITSNELVQEQQKKLNATNLSRNRPVVKIKQPTCPIMKKNSKDFNTVESARSDGGGLSDDDDFYSKLSFDCSSLEDEIFQELEKVAHDEAKLNAAIQNFDKILNEYKDKQSKDAAKKEEKPSAIPKRLQKSKTCSIIESKCILKRNELKKSAKQSTTRQKFENPFKVDNIETITNVNYYQLKKSLWNLKDFDSFAKSAVTKTCKVQSDPRKTVDVKMPDMLPRANSLWEVRASQPIATSTPRPAYSRQSSISKIPIKSSSKLSASMMQLNSSSSAATTTSHCNISKSNSSSKLRKSTMYASTLGLSSSSPSKNQSYKLSQRRSSFGSSSTAIAKVSIGNWYVETKASLQRRNLISSSNSMNKVPTGIKSNSSYIKQSYLNSAKSEMSIHGKFALKEIDRQKYSHSSTKQNSSMKVQRENETPSDTLLEKCLVKGQELLRKVEELNDASKNNTATLIDSKKRDYIPKQQATTIEMNESSDVSMNIKLSSVQNTNGSKQDYDNNSTCEIMKVNAIANQQCITGNCDSKKQTESENAVDESVASSKIINIETQLIINDHFLAPTSESCEIMIPYVMDSNIDISCVEAIKYDKLIKDYNSDCSEDSGHISNENDENSIVTMNIMKPVRKISEELMEIFEKKSSQPSSTQPTIAKAKVIELNNVNLIKSSMDINPIFNNNMSKNKISSKICKSEVKIFINNY